MLLYVLYALAFIAFRRRLRRASVQEDEKYSTVLNFQRACRRRFPQPNILSVQFYPAFRLGTALAQKQIGAM